jgi:hypothetical protein
VATRNDKIEAVTLDEEKRLNRADDLRFIVVGQLTELPPPPRTA